MNASLRMVNGVKKLVLMMVFEWFIIRSFLMVHRLMTAHKASEWMIFTANSSQQLIGCQQMVGNHLGLVWNLYMLLGTRGGYC